MTVEDLVAKLLEFPQAARVVVCPDVFDKETFWPLSVQAHRADALVVICAERL